MQRTMSVLSMVTALCLLLGAGTWWERLLWQR